MLFRSTQNVQWVKAEPRDDGPSINMIIPIDIATRGAEEKAMAESLIWKAVEKMESLDLKKEKETFVEDQREMAKNEASTSNTLVDPKAYKAVNPFLQACMKM